MTSRPTPTDPAAPKASPPEWAEPGKPGFATRVMEGVEGGHDGMDAARSGPEVGGTRRRLLTRRELVEGVRAGNRRVLAQAITLIESNAPHHLDQGQAVLQELLPYTGNSLRVGITGVPGAGKSTFINAFGKRLCDQGLKVAVLAIDPSSTMTGGSILGDKTRMADLIGEERCFIRPSPSGGALGGVNRKTRESMLLCEAAGYEVILVETVGVGQNEATVRSMTDFFLLLTLTGAGDELQSIKRGVIENADALVIHKADGENLMASRRLQSEVNQALRYLTSPTPGWRPQALLASSLRGDGLSEIWQMLCEFRTFVTGTGFFEERRHQQVVNWMVSMVHEQLLSRFEHDPAVRLELPLLRRKVAEGVLPPTAAARRLLDLYAPDQRPKDQPPDEGRQL